MHCKVGDIVKVVGFSKKHEIIEVVSDKYRIRRKDWRNLKGCVYGDWLVKNDDIIKVCKKKKKKEC